MRTLAFDGRMGASGDMVCAALVAAGADPAVLDPVEDTLDVRYAVGTTTKRGIAATTVDVLRDAAGEGGVPDGDDGAGGGGVPDGDDGAGGGGVPDGDDGAGGDADGNGEARDDDHDHGSDSHGHDHGHDHDHGSDSHGHDHDHGSDSHGHDHGHDHGHGSDHTHAEGTGPRRTYPEVVDIVEGMGLGRDVEATALGAFRRLGEAEAAVHDTDLESTHFHEVGADDAIADVVGAALLLADLAPDRVVTTPVATGGGEASMSHGTYPVPAPAVVEIAADADWSVRGGPVERELLTPTGAALLAEVAEGVDHVPALDVAASGYGAGDADPPGRPNVLRALVGDGGGLSRESIAVLETNLDDATPEVLGGLQETLTEAGALDVTILPATMKKSRPGHLVKVVTAPEDAERVARRLAEETGTLGVRAGSAGHRWVADRAVETAALDVDGETREVRVKVGSDAGGTVYDLSAEYDDALAVARETGLSVRAVMRRAESTVARRLDGSE